MKKKLLITLSMVSVAALLTACGGTKTTTETETNKPSEAITSEVTTTEVPEVESSETDVKDNEEETIEEVDTTTDNEESSTTENTQGGKYEGVADLATGAVTINGIDFKFPCKYSDFAEKLELTTKDSDIKNDLEQLKEDGDADIIVRNADGEQMGLIVSLENLDEVENPTLEDCYVSGFNINLGMGVDGTKDKFNVELPGPLTWATNKSDLVNIFGEPERESKNSMKWSCDYYEESNEDGFTTVAELKVSFEDDGTITGIDYWYDAYFTLD